MTEDPLVIVPMPPLVTVLLYHEKQKGEPLTEKEVLSIRDQVVCMTLPYSQATQLAQKRGYEDMRLEHAWDDWSVARPSLGLSP